MFQEEVTLSFIFQTIAVILVITAVGIYFVKKKAKEVKVGDIIEIKYLEKSEKFKILQIPTTKSTPKSKIDEYVQRLN